MVNLEFAILVSYLIFLSWKRINTKNNNKNECSIINNFNNMGNTNKAASCIPELRDGQSSFSFHICICYYPGMQLVGGGRGWSPTPVSKNCLKLSWVLGKKSPNCVRLWVKVFSSMLVKTLRYFTCWIFFVLYMKYSSKCPALFQETFPDFKNSGLHPCYLKFQSSAAILEMKKKSKIDKVTKMLKIGKFNFDDEK